ncbi:hypothetical protein GCM10029963_40660 [Micromonospora andamanensis]
MTVDPPLAARLGSLAVTLAPPDDPAALGGALLSQARATAATGDLAGALRLVEGALDTSPGPDIRLAATVLRADLADRLGAGVPAMARLAGSTARLWIGYGPGCPCRWGDSPHGTAGGTT